MSSSSVFRFRGRAGQFVRPIHLLFAAGLGLLTMHGQAGAQSSAQVMVSIQIPPIVQVEGVRSEPPVQLSESGDYMQSVELVISANAEWVLHAHAGHGVPPGLEWSAETASARSDGRLHPFVLVGDRQLHLASGDGGRAQRIRIVYRWRDADGDGDPPTFRYVAEPLTPGGFE